MVPSQSGWTFAGLPSCPSRVLLQFTLIFYEIWNVFEVKECHGTTSLPLLQSPLATSDPIHLYSAPSTPTLLPSPSLHSISEAYLCSLCNYITPTLGLTADQYQTHSDLVPTPRAAIYIPFLHLSYLPDPFSLTIMGNYIRKHWVRGNRALRAQGDKP